MKLAVIDRVVSQGLYFNGFAISFKLIRNKSHEKIQLLTNSFTIYSSGEGSWGRDLIDL